MARRSPCWHFGDVDGDGYVTFDDAMLVVLHIVGTIVLTPEQIRRADVFNVGTLDIFDAMYIAQYVLGTRDTFPVCALLPEEDPFPAGMVEVRSAAGALITVLENASNISYEQAINMLGKMSFEMPSDDTKIQYLLNTNEIWLYQKGLLVDCYRMRMRYSTRGDMLKETIEADQIASFLLDDIIPSYEATLADTKSATMVLTELLAFQTGANPVVMGGVEAILDNNFAVVKVSWTNIWKACEQIRDAVGGILYVKFDPRVPLNRTLWLSTTMGADEGQQIRVGKNLEGISRETDYGGMATKFWPIGQNNLVLSSALVVKEVAIISSD